MQGIKVTLGLYWEKYWQLNLPVTLSKIHWGLDFNMPSSTHLKKKLIEKKSTI